MAPALMLEPERRGVTGAMCTWCVACVILFLVVVVLVLVEEEEEEEEITQWRKEAQT